MIADLQCIEKFKKAINWLEDEIFFNETKLNEKINEQQKIRSNPSRDKSAFDYFLPDSCIADLEKKLRLRYSLEDTEGIFVFKKLGLPVVNDFINAAANPEFWDNAPNNFFDDPQIAWFLNEIGLGKNPFFKEWLDSILNRQLITGHIQTNYFDHVGPLRTLAATKPNSKYLDDALKFWLENWEGYDDCPQELSVGVLALSEIDYDVYLPVITQQVKCLKKLQNGSGSWSLYPSLKSDPAETVNTITTGYAVWAIARVNGTDDKNAQLGLEWIYNKQLGNGSWGDRLDLTTPALYALLAMGQGPQVPLEQVNFESVKLAQRLKKQKPVFLHTSPFYKGSAHIKEINNQIIQMLQSAKKEIRISSLYIDMLYEEIINIKKQNPALLVKVITRPIGAPNGLRGGIARNAIDLLKIETRGNLVQSLIVHARMVIIDESEVLVSSSDMTRDQLYDEFNAGIWTQDKDTVKKAIEFFDNLFEFENKIKSNDMQKT
jgi:hypothetical protein